MLLSLLNHSALALFAQRTRIPTSARSIGFCAIWVCISSSSSSACHELLCSRAFLFIVMRSAQHPQIPRFLQNYRGIWPMLLSLLNHSELALFAHRTRIPTSACSIGFYVIWVCISSCSLSCTMHATARRQDKDPENVVALFSEFQSITEFHGIVSCCELPTVVLLQIAS